MGQEIKFYLGEDTKSLQEHMKNEKKDWFSNLNSYFYNIFYCC